MKLSSQPDWNIRSYHRYFKRPGFDVVSIFSIPKSFRGNIGVIQRNAIRSWTLLRPKPQIILLGNDEGTREIAEEYQADWIPDVKRNEFGTPRVDDIFVQAEKRAVCPLLCYVNSDILLMSDFFPVVTAIAGRFTKFLMIGIRHNLEVASLLPFDLNWEKALRLQVARSGELHPGGGVDYFVYPRGLWKKIPPFAIGRTVWDNWLIYGARLRGAPVVDATAAVMAVHQNHEYSHPQGKDGIYFGEEARRNLQVGGGERTKFRYSDATHVFGPQGFKNADFGIYRERRKEAEAVLFTDRLKAYFSFFNPAENVSNFESEPAGAVTTR